MAALDTAVGLLAAICTTGSYIPQVWKCWKTKSAGDLSLKMFGILGCGIALWVAYGILQHDPVIIIANAVSLALLGYLLVFKIHERMTGRG